MSAPRYREVKVGGCVAANQWVDTAGVHHLRSAEALQPYPARLTDRLEEWARHAPDRTQVAQRGPDGEWRRISYAQMLDRVRRIGQALAVRGLSPDRPIAILSDNDLDHYTLALAAQWVGVPFTPVSVAYSTVSKDFAKLKQILGTLTPGLVFAADGHAYRNAIATVVPADTEIWVGSGEDTPALQGRKVTRFDALLATEPGPEELEAHGHVGPDTIAKFLFTSGSTKLPKAVITTQRMLCANQQMLRQTLRRSSPTSRRCSSTGCRGTTPSAATTTSTWRSTTAARYYIDDGKPSPEGIRRRPCATCATSPRPSTSTCPRASRDARRSAGARRCPARQLSLARARCSCSPAPAFARHAWDRLDRACVKRHRRDHPHDHRLRHDRDRALRHLRHRPRVTAGHVGLPAPGCEVQAGAGRRQARSRASRAPTSCPATGARPSRRRDAFDDEGFYQTGDALRFVDAQHPEHGLRFDGRIAEDFKLSTGTFVSVGPLRTGICSPATR